MTPIITKPETPAEGFRRGALWTFFGPGLSGAGIGLMRNWDDGPLHVLPWALGALLALTLIGGLIVAAWRAAQGVTYRRYYETD